MMTQAQTIDPATTGGFGATERRDTWWVGPLATALGLGGFVIYATFRAIYNAGYQFGMGTPVLPDHAYVLSPFFSPLIVLPWLPAWISPAFLILWVPGGFRVTCYYYRKAYYRAFFLDPVGCAVGEPGRFCGIPRGHHYKGETGLLLFQNLHRYFFYLVLIFPVILSMDVVHTCLWPTPDGNGYRFNLSVATLVLATQTTLLTLYTASCHSFRHLIGGRLDSFSRAPLGKVRYRLWAGVSALNAHHMFWAWTSLFAVAFANFYVWMVASEWIKDKPLIPWGG
jgi:hypothetical protein